MSITIMYSGATIFSSSTGTNMALKTSGTYMKDDLTINVPTGVEGVPAVTKGTWSNYTKRIIPQVTNTEGYITGETLTGAAITVSASELVSGTSNITSNGTFDITNYQSVSVNVSGGGGSGDIDALIQRTISGTYVNSTVSVVGLHAFHDCYSLTAASFPVCTTISSSAFAGCSSLTTISFPACTTIYNFAFAFCSRLTTISFPACTTIGPNVFAFCSRLTTISFPACTTIGPNVFAVCTSLTTISFPACTTIGGSAFNACSRLTTASFSVCTTIGAYAFSGCSRLTTASFSVCTTIGAYAFSGCSSLTTISFPACTTIGSSAFVGCFKLSTASFPKLSTITGSHNFRSCRLLVSLYLKGSSLCTLSNSNAFSSSPIGGYSASAGQFGSIYVPSSLLASYKAATNWTYFSARFVGQ